jgi:hypothetical protein
MMLCANTLAINLIDSLLIIHYCDQKQTKYGCAAVLIKNISHHFLSFDFLMTIVKL